MRRILLLRHSRILAKHKMALVSVMFWRLVVRSFIVAEDTSPCLILPRDTNGSVSVRTRGRSSRINILDLCCCPFPIIFDLDFGQEATSIFMGQGNIVLFVILKLITHRWGEAVLNYNSNLINRELFVAEFPILCSITITLHWSGRQVLR